MTKVTFLYKDSEDEAPVIGAVVENVKDVIVNPYFNILSVYADDEHLSLDLDNFYGLEIEGVEYED